MPKPQQITAHPISMGDEVDPPLPIVGLTFAAIAVANAIAFAINPAGAWSALRDAALHLMGAR